MATDRVLLSSVSRLDSSSPPPYSLTSREDAIQIHTDDIQNNLPHGFQTTPDRTKNVEISSQNSSTIALHDGHVKPKPSGHERLFQDQRWPPVLFLLKKIDLINQWWLGHRYLSLWWCEAICCLIALGALIATVATIRTYESKPLPQWRYGLTINAIVAIYTVILKAAIGLVLAEGISHLKWIAVTRPQPLSTFVTYDTASRGPLGALALLWENMHNLDMHNLGKLHALPFISSFGALLTVLIFLLDPFSQQIIRTYECKIRLTGENGTIARTNRYQEVRI